MKRPSVWIQLLCLAALAGSAQASPPGHRAPFGQASGACENYVGPGVGEIVLGCQDTSPEAEAGRVESLKARLARDMDVHVAADGKPFDTYFLAYLYYYFKHMGVRGPIYLHPSSETGPRIVSKTGGAEAGTHLKFTVDAGKGTVTEAVRRLQEHYAKHPELLRQGDGFKPKLTLTLDFNNTLIEQLNTALLSKATIDQQIQSRYHLVTYADPKGQYAKDSVAMSTSETALLYKQLLDLPDDVTGHLKLNRIVRMRHGFSFGSGIVARYSQDWRAIGVSDDAFAGSANAAEETFIHEIGHAHWYALPAGLQKEFVGLSWVPNPTHPEWTTPKDRKLFMSPYSRSNPQEDFAVHFAAYVNNSELLKSKAPLKYAFLRDRIFHGVEYYSTAAPNARVAVSSDLPDTEAPTLGLPIKDALKLSCILDKNDPTRARIIADLTGLHDDISGVEMVEVDLNDDKSGGKLLPNMRPIVLHIHPGAKAYEGQFDEKKGTYRLEGDVDLRQVPADDYSVVHYRFKDKAGNYEYFNSDDTPELRSREIKVHIPGLAKRAAKASQTIDFSRIKITPNGEKNGVKIFLVELPIAHLPNISAFNLEWHQVNQDIFMRHDFYVYPPYYSAMQSRLLSKPGDAVTRMEVAFSPDTPSDDVVLVSAALEYGETPVESAWHASGSATTAQQKGPSNVRFRLSNPKAPPPRQPDADINALRAAEHVATPAYNGGDGETKLAPELDSKGGNRQIRIEVPLVGADPENVAMTVVVRSPTGNSLYQSFRTHPYRNNNIYGDWYKKMEVKKINGRDVAVLYFDLEANNEAGTYLIEEISVQGMLAESDQPENVITPYQPHGKPRKIKLLERGIRRTVTVYRDPGDPLGPAQGETVKQMPPPKPQPVP